MIDLYRFGHRFRKTTLIPQDALDVALVVLREKTANAKFFASKRNAIRDHLSGAVPMRIVGDEDAVHLKQMADAFDEDCEIALADARWLSVVVGALESSFRRQVGVLCAEPELDGEQMAPAAIAEDVP